MSGGSPQRFDGGDGIDTAVFHGNRANYSLTPSQVQIPWNGPTYSGYSVTDSNSSRDGSTLLANVERLQFADGKFAIDVNGNAGAAMEFIGVVAPSLLNDLAVRGTIINLFDSGNTMNQLSQLALQYNLLPSDAVQLVNTVFHNVTGGTASTETTNALVTYVQAHGAVDFVSTVAGLHLNVDLVGLQNTGVQYI